VGVGPALEAALADVGEVDDRGLGRRLRELIGRAPGDALVRALGVGVAEVLVEVELQLGGVGDADVSEQLTPDGSDRALRVACPCAEAPRGCADGPTRGSRASGSG